eukprot:jgi/Mesvir1/8454/Mv19886-RA.1
MGDIATKTGFLYFPMTVDNESGVFSPQNHSSERDSARVSRRPAMDASDNPPQLCWCNKCKSHKPVALFTSVKDGNTHTKRCDPCRARERVWAQKHRREQAERLRQLTTSSRVGANTWRLPNSCVSCPPLLDSTPVNVFRRAPCHTREAVAVGPYDRLACPSSPPPSVDSPKWVSFSSFANSPGGASEIQCVVDRRCDRDDGGASCAGTGYPAPLSRCSPVADGSLSSSPLFTFVDEDAIVDFDFTDEEISRIMRSPDPAETPVASTTGAVDETLSCSIDVGAFWAECEENWEKYGSCFAPGGG